MSDEKKNETLTDRKKEVIQSIQRAAEIYTIASVCTKMPYVFCDPETFQIILATGKDHYDVFTLRELLPLGFGPANLD